jgi:hypothetical protein
MCRRKGFPQGKKKAQPRSRLQNQKAFQPAFAHYAVGIDHKL